jgi:hypothetical protein
MGAPFFPNPNGQALDGAVAPVSNRSWREGLSEIIGAWTGIGGGRQTLYVTADSLIALRQAGRHWQTLASFRLGAVVDTDRGASSAIAASPVPEAFREWISRWRGDTFVFLLDSADEEIETDELPNVSGRDRDKVLDRRLKQRFRDAALTTWSVPRGTRVKKDVKTPGQRECTLLVGMRQRNPMMSWIESAVLAGARIAAVESLALRSAALLRASGAGTTALLASIQPAGLRQSLVHNGEVCFTRLQPLATGAPWQRVAEELDRTVRFLMMSRGNLRPLIQAGKVPIVVIGDGIDHHSDGAFTASALPLREAAVPITWIDSGSEPHAAPVVDASGAHTGLSLGGLNRFLLTRHGQRADYANTEMRANWRTARALGAGWSLATLGLLVALGANLFIQYTLSGRMEAVGARPRMAAVEVVHAQAQQLQAQLATQAVSAEEMDAVVQLAAQLQSRHVDAAQTLRWIGQSLNHDAAVNLDEISWEPVRALVGAAAPAAGAPPGATAAPSLPPSGVSPAPATADAASAGAATPTLVHISGYVDPAISKELANNKVDEMFARLKAGCNCTGRILVPPYDPSMDVAYAASLRDNTRVASPRFTMELERPAPAMAVSVAGRNPSADLSKTAGAPHG